MVEDVSPITRAAWRPHVLKGWRPLYDRLLEDLTRLDPHFQISHAKRKFGQLRVYLESYAPGAHALIDAATRASRLACEACGGSGCFGPPRTSISKRSVTRTAWPCLSRSKPPSSRASFRCQWRREN
jgi:hypothetical protein